MIFFPSGELYEFIPLEWLKKWLDDSTATKEIDNTLLLCSHGKLHPDKVGDSKRVSLQAAQQLYERYGGGPRLSSKCYHLFNLCWNAILDFCFFFKPCVLSSITSSLKHLIYVVNCVVFFHFCFLIVKGVPCVFVFNLPDFYRNKTSLYTQSLIGY